MGCTDALELILPTMMRKSERQRMQSDEPTSCPKWFPIFLMGMGLIGAFACQILV